MHCIGGSWLVSVLFVAVLIILFLSKTFHCVFLLWTNYTCQLASFTMYIYKETEGPSLIPSTRLQKARVTHQALAQCINTWPLSMIFLIASHIIMAETFHKCNTLVIWQDIQNLLQWALVLWVCLCNIVRLLTLRNTCSADLHQCIQHWPLLLGWTLVHREDRLFLDTCSLITGSSQCDL